MKNVIIFVESPFNKRDFNRFGIEILANNGFHVKVWDFCPFLHPLLHKNYIPPDAYLCRELRVFQAQRDAIDSIKSLKHDEVLIISFLSFNTKTVLIYRTLSSSNINYGFVIGSALPSINSSGKSRNPLIASRAAKLFRYIRHRQPSLLITLLFRFITAKAPLTILGIKPAKFVSVPSLGSSLPRLVSGKTDIIYACSFDYNFYVDSKTKPSKTNLLGNLYEGQFILFLDEFLPFHPDYLHLNVSPPCSPNEYYPALNHFFDAIELALNSEVVIAAHPRSNYDHHPDYFSGRKMFFGKTHQLVKQSSCVITHSSTAVNFAVIYKKPIYFISLEVIKRYKEYPVYDIHESMAKSLSKKPIIIDRQLDIDWQSEMIVDLNAYRQYLDLYIKSPLAPEKNSWQIFADYASKVR